MRTVIVGTIAILISVYVDVPSESEIGFILGIIAFLTGAMMAFWQDIAELVR